MRISLRSRSTSPWSDHWKNDSKHGVVRCPCAFSCFPSSHFHRRFHTLLWLASLSTLRHLPISLDNVNALDRPYDANINANTFWPTPMPTSAPVPRQLYPSATAALHEPIDDPPMIRWCKGRPEPISCMGEVRWEDKLGTWGPSHNMKCMVEFLY